MQHLRVTTVNEPYRRSCKPRNSSKSLDLWVSKVARSFGIGVSSLCTVSNLYVYIRSEYCHKKRKLDRYHPHAAHPTIIPELRSLARNLTLDAYKCCPKGKLSTAAGELRRTAWADR